MWSGRKSAHVDLNVEEEEEEEEEDNNKGEEIEQPLLVLPRHSEPNVLYAKEEGEEGEETETKKTTVSSKSISWWCSFTMPEDTEKEKRVKAIEKLRERRRGMSSSSKAEKKETKKESSFVQKEEEMMEEEEEEEEEEPTILDEPTKRRRSLLQELGNGTVPSDDGILGEVVDGIEEVFAPAPAPTTMEEEEKEDLPPVRRKLLQVMGTPAMEEGMMPDMTGMMDPLPGTGMMDMGEAPSPAPAPAPADADIIDDEIISPGRKLLQEEEEEPMPPVDESIALPPTESIIAEAPAPAPAPMEVVGTFEITTITGTITSDDYDPDGTGPN